MKPPRDIRRGEPILASWLNAAKNAALNAIRVESGSGLTLRQIGGSVTIGLQRPQIVPPSGAFENGFFARITSHSPMAGEANRWVYGFIRVLYQKSGNYIDQVSGVTGTAYNNAEVPNTSTGEQGNGVDLSVVPASYNLVPIGIGHIVRLTPVTNCDTGDIEYVFDLNNAMELDC